MEPSEYVHYIIEHRANERVQVLESLAAYQASASTLTDVVTLRIPRTDEASLLERLALIDNITYRRALPRRALTEER